VFDHQSSTMDRLPAAARLCLSIAVLFVVACGQPDAPGTPAVKTAQSEGDKPAAEAPAAEGEERKFPMAEGPPAPADAPTIDSVAPTSAKLGEKVVVKGKKLAPVQCALPNEAQDEPDGIPAGPDPALWLIPASGKPVMAFAFNDPDFSNGKPDDGEWMAQEIDFKVPGELAPGSYRVVVKTACGFSKPVNLQVSAG
jgi:hypothetical protein